MTPERPLRFGPQAIHALEELSSTLRRELIIRVRAAFRENPFRDHVHVDGFCVLFEGEAADRVVQSLSPACERAQPENARH